MTDAEPTAHDPRPGSRRRAPAGAGRPEPLPDRPALTTPPSCSARPSPAERQQLAAQPWLGLGGLLLAAVVFFALALGTGSTASRRC